MRMLMNNLDPEVAEKPDELIVYGGAGRAARDWPSFHAIVRSLRELENDETLLVQSGKPVGVFRTHAEAPRVLLANSNLVGHWSNDDEFHRLEQLGLIMYGQMTAGSWIYIGSQGILQGTFETFAAAADKHFQGSLRGRWIVSGGMGGMSGAQPLAATLNGACYLGVEVDPARIEKRLETGYCDRMARSLDEALALIEEARQSGAGALGRVGWQLRGRDSGTGAARHGARYPDRPDQRARRSARLCPQWNDAGRSARAARFESRRIHATLHPGHGPARRGHAGAETNGRRNVRLRQQHPRPGQARRRGKTPSIFPASCPNTFARCSAKDAGRFAGWRCRDRPPTFTPPTSWRWSCSRPTPRCSAGCAWLASACSFRDCRRASAGWATASEPSSAWRSTIMCGAEKLKRPS